MGRGRRGSYNVLVALMVPVVLAMLALGIDVWTIVQAQSKLQVAVDGAAIAGASAPTRLAEARRRALANAEYNELYPGSEITEVDLVTGEYNDDVGTFQQLTTRPNAVRVTARGKVALPFGSFIGIDTAPISAEAHAWYVAFDCQIFVDSFSDLSGTVRGDGWNSCEEPVYAGGTEPISYCSNGDIDLRGSVTYDGDMNPGPGGSISLGGSASYTGDSHELSYEIDLPDFEREAALARLYNDNGGRFGLHYTLSGGREVTIGPGTFYFETLRVVGTSKLNLQPPIDIYVDGTVFVSGDSEITTLGTNAEASNLIVTDNSTVDLLGTVSLYGSLIAPDADVRIGGTAEFYGLFMADTLDVNGTADFHTDSCLSFEDFGLDLPSQALAPTLVTIQ